MEVEHLSRGHQTTATAARKLRIRIIAKCGVFFTPDPYPYTHVVCGECTSIAWQEIHYAQTKDRQAQAGDHQ